MQKAIMSVVAVLTGAVGLTAQITLSVGTYSEDFDGIASGLPSGWDVRTGANATSLGSTATFNTAPTSWDTTTGQFRNSASAIGSAATDPAATQNAHTNRAVGLRQTGAFGDPGASFNVNLNSTGLQVTNISIDLMMLSVQPRSTTWEIQYGLGASPTSFTTLATWTDPNAFGTTTFSFTTADFGTALDNQGSFWFRVVALTASTGGGNRDTIAIDNFSITTIPEPSSYPLILVVAVAVTAYLRRRIAS